MDWLHIGEMQEEDHDEEEESHSHDHSSHSHKRKKRHLASDLESSRRMKRHGEGNPVDEVGILSTLENSGRSNTNNSHILITFIYCIIYYIY